MGAWPDPQFKLEDLGRQSDKRQLLWWNDFLAWPSVVGQMPTFGIDQAAGTRTQANTGEGGWASVGGTGTDANAPRIRGASSLPSMLPTRNPRAILRGTFAVPHAEISYQGIGFTQAPTFNLMEQLSQGRANCVGLTQTT